MRHHGAAPPSVKNEAVGAGGGGGDADS